MDPQCWYCNHSEQRRCKNVRQALKCDNVNEYTRIDVRLEIEVTNDEKENKSKAIRL